MPINEINVHSIYGEITLPDTTPTVVPFTYDGQTVTEIPITGQFYIPDVMLGIGFVYWSIEVNRGQGYTPIATFGFVLLSPTHTEIKKFKTAIEIDGARGVLNNSPGVLMRIRATAVTAPATTNITIRAYTEGY